MPTKSESDTNTTEDKPHEFLEYENVTVLFVFCALWDVGRWSFAELKDRFEKSSLPCRIVSKIHQRAVILPWTNLTSVYQPSFVGCDTVLTTDSGIGVDAELVVDSSEEHTIAVKVGCTVRLLSTGGVVYTLNVTPSFQSEDSNAKRFQTIHWLLRLAGSTTNEKGRTETEAARNTSAKLKFDGPAHLAPFLGKNLTEEETRKNSYTPEELFMNFLENPPVEWERDRLLIWSGFVEELQNVSKTCGKAFSAPWQSPFVVTVAKLNQESIRRLRARSLKTCKEVASILCKLTLDNSQVINDFQNFGDDYLFRVLHIDRELLRVPNSCLDGRLFFAFSERGALVCCGEPSEIPASFVITSFVNSLEIARSRWFFGCHLNTRLNRLIDSTVCSAGSHGTSQGDRAKEFMTIRRMYSAFIHDPIDYLLDGGSVTEIARKAESDFGILSIESDVRHKLNVLDSLRRDLDIIQFEQSFGEES